MEGLYLDKEQNTTKPSSRLDPEADDQCSMLSALILLPKFVNIFLVQAKQLWPQLFACWEHQLTFFSDFSPIILMWVGSAVLFLDLSF